MDSIGASRQVGSFGIPRHRRWRGKLEKLQPLDQDIRAESEVQVGCESRPAGIRNSPPDLRAGLSMVARADQMKMAAGLSE